MKRHVSPLALASVLLASTPALAQETPAESGEQTDSVAETATTERKTPEQTGPITYGIDDRVWVESLDLTKFDTGENEGDIALYNRLQLDLGGDWGNFKFQLEAEFFRGEMTGSLYATPPDERTNTGTRPSETLTETRNIADPFQAWVGWRPAVLELRAGLMKSHFGMGVLANDGREDKWRLFNQSYGADRGFRALLATRPGGLSKNRVARNITVAIAGDYVYRDDNASLLDGDQAVQVLGTVFYQDEDPANPENSTFVGAYFAYRDQEDREIDGVEPNDTLSAFAFDISARKSWTTDSFHFKTGLETALLAGETTRAYTNTLDEQTDILGFGAAGEFLAAHRASQVALKILGGYASGDANPDDDTLYRFRFDPNYKVGLVLFDYYMPEVTRGAYARATDPNQSGEPPKGVYGLINDGQVQNAIYVNPQLMFGDPEGLLAGVGMLWAWSAVPLYDPYNTFANGGELVGPNNNEEASRRLGVEVDVAVQWKYDLVERLDLDLKAEYGIFFPGAAFDDAFGATAPATSVVRGRVGLNW